jgi:hypothetical protein
VVVEPGVDIGPGTVVIVTPLANLRDRTFWVTRDLEADVFRIRLTAPRNRHTPFAWLIVESDFVGSDLAAEPEAE